MKKYYLLLLLPLLHYTSSGQTAGKTGGVNENAISKIGSVPISAISKTGNVITQVYFKNCKEIKQNNPVASDGVYTIDPDGPGIIAPFNCYCDMTTNGGGWTMVGHYRHPSTENAPADLDNRDYAYFMKASNDETYGKPEYLADPNSSGAWTDWRVLSGVAWPIEFAIVVDQASWSTSWDNYPNKVIHRVKSRLIMPNYGTAQDLTSVDNLWYKLYFTDGWTDVGSTSASAYYYWYPYNSSGQYLLMFHESNYAYTPVGSPTNYHYGIHYGGGMPGPLEFNTWHHSGRLLIR